MLPSKCFIYSFTGEHDVRVVEGYEQIISVDKIIIHPDYDAYTLDYDVALIKLKNPIKFNRNVRPVCLPKSDFDPGTICYITGWGLTAERGNVSQVNKNFNEIFLLIFVENCLSRFQLSSLCLGF